MPDKDPDDALHLLKLCVGADSVDDLVAWQRQVSSRRAAAGQDPLPRHVTRMWPRRHQELLDGGSLYWVIRGLILVRQPILALERVTGEDGVTRCAIRLSPEIVRVEARPRAPFQGWRYLTGADAPPDLTAGETEGGALPADLQEALSTFGVVRS